MDLDEETKALLVGALRAHPEFLDIWRAMDEGEPDAFVEIDNTVSRPHPGRGGDDE